MAVRIRVPTPSPARLAELALDSPDPTVLFDAEGHVLAANDAARREGVHGPASEGPPLTVLLPFWTDDEARRRLLASVAQGGVKNLELRFQVYGEAAERVFWISAVPVPSEGPGAFAASAREVSEKSAEWELLRVCYEELAAQSDRDPVTGFQVRDRFRTSVDREIARAARVGKPLALIHLDLDDFKTLNETHGFAAGDEYLFRLGELIRNELPAVELAGRFGGDEVGLLLRDTGASEGAVRAEKLVGEISRLAPPWEGSMLTLTSSAGVAAYPEHGTTTSELLQAADMALQQAKRRGRARVRVYDREDQELDRIGTLRSQVERIRAALAEERFLPVFQPVAEVGSGRVVAVETLARLREEGGRLASPGEFLDAAERFGFVTAIDRLVIAGAFEALGAHRKVFPELEMAINLSGHDFEDDSLVAHISSLARAKWVRPERVTFEITETAALRDLARVQHFTRALIAEGFRFALDDFGMGFSSFRYLRELPVASLKFDISYIRNLASQPENRVFVRGIAGICRDLGIRTVAEGVESAEVLAILGELGVERAQGHFVGHPALELPRSALPAA